MRFGIMEGTLWYDLENGEIGGVLGQGDGIVLHGRLQLVEYVSGPRDKFEGIRLGDSQTFVELFRHPIPYALK